MKSTCLLLAVSLILAIALLTSCTSSETKFEMEMSRNYDDSDPFINEKLFYVSEDTDSVDFDATFQMEGESGLLEIADNETKNVVWNKAWSDSADEEFDISLNNLDKNKEYVIRLTCTGVVQAKVVMTSENSLVRTRVKPAIPSGAQPGAKVERRINEHGHKEYSYENPDGSAGGGVELD